MARPGIRLQAPTAAAGKPGPAVDSRARQLAVRAGVFTGSAARGVPRDPARPAGFQLCPEWGRPDDGTTVPAPFVAGRSSSEADLPRDSPGAAPSGKGF